MAGPKEINPEPVGSIPAAGPMHFAVYILTALLAQAFDPWCRELPYAFAAR
jgi:hypothetical protein